MARKGRSAGGLINASWIRRAADDNAEVRLADPGNDVWWVEIDVRLVSAALCLNAGQWYQLNADGLDCAAMVMRVKSLAGVVRGVSRDPEALVDLVARYDVEAAEAVHRQWRKEDVR